MRRRRMSFLVLGLCLGLSGASYGGDSQSLKGQTLEGIMSAMRSHIEGNSVDGKYVVYDAVAGKLRKLTFDKVHEGIMKNHGFYVSCADFVDDHGGRYDLDLLVVDKGGSFQVLETVVHAVNGETRKYHLEDK